MSVFCRRIKGMLLSKVTDDSYVCRQTSEHLQVFPYICNLYHRGHEKTSYVSNYAFIALLHEWVDRGQTLVMLNGAPVSGELG